MVYNKRMPDPAFFIPFATILVTEIGDNSFLTLAYLASKSHRRLTVLAAAMLAYAIMNGVSVVLGNTLADVLNVTLLHGAAGLVFIGFGLAAFFIKENPHADPHAVFKKLFLTTLVLILATEILDRSNFSTLLFATQYDALRVIAGVLTAHLIAALIAIELGKRLLHRIPARLLTQVGGLLFLAIGAYTLLRLT